MPVRKALDAFYSALVDDDARDLYERAPCGFLSTLEDGTIVKANETFATWIGYSKDELLDGRRFIDLLTAGGKIYYETHFSPTLLMHRQIREVAFELLRPDGTRLPALVTSVTNTDSDGRTVIRTVVFDAAERTRYENELLLAKERAEASEAANRALVETLQQTLIPPAVPRVPGLEIAAVYEPAGDGHEVGGDFYDLFKTASDTWFVVVGDVCGKGVEAAVVTSAARFAVRSAAMEHTDLSQILTMVNTVLLAYESQRFCTLGIAKLERRGDRWTATFASAGHPPAILASAMGSPPEEVAAVGPLAGVLEAPSFETVTVELSPGDSFVLYTDGVIEARRGRAFFGEERLIESVGRRRDSAKGLADGLLGDVVAFQDGTKHDDVVIVALRIPD